MVPGFLLLFPLVFGAYKAMDNVLVHSLLLYIGAIRLGCSAEGGYSICILAFCFFICRQGCQLEEKVSKSRALAEDENQEKNQEKEPGKRTRKKSLERELRMKAWRRKDC